ncbi:hypothetical protein [Labrenzia sp. PHM005]|uniref:hypothetical protein n=1 Tax=Labrenzia sp. PHM005 TaxID=2590016 RepID=UPI00113FDF53|nr:hypothetical protein [Labrenzia sp. PHM005]QDG78429.1 hypothetical protein FJ695_22625 [Labrenzia sp. PHM005]
MTAEREHLSVKQRLSGQGLVDTLKRERALVRKEKKRREPAPPAEPPSADPLPAASPPNEALHEARSPRDMAIRLYRAFAGQMDQLEAHLKDLFAEAGREGAAGLQEIDKTVKTLASLAKTLGALMDLKSDTEPDGEGKNLDDREELRAALAQRLERLCERSKG